MAKRRGRAAARATEAIEEDLDGGALPSFGGGPGEGEPDADGEDADAAGAGDDVVVKVSRARPRKKRPKASPPPTPLEDVAAGVDELELLATRDAGSVITVERVGPREYYGTPVQVAYCGELAATTPRVREAIQRRWGGGEYELTAKLADGRIVRPRVKLAGRPLPIDPDEQRDAEEARAAMAQAGAMTSMGLGWVWVPAMQRHVWTGPGEQPTQPEPMPPGMPMMHPPTDEIDELRGELAAMKRERELADLEARIAAKFQSQQPSFLETYFKQQELDLRRREAEAKEQRERDEARRAEERAERQRQWEREQDDRKAQRDMMDKWMQMQLESIGKRGSLKDTLGELSAAREFLVPGDGADDSEAAQLERVVGAGEKLITTLGRELRDAIGSATGGGGASPPAGNPNGDLTDEQVGAVLEEIIDLHRRGTPPRDAVAMLVGFARGHRINARKMLDVLREVTPEQVPQVLEQIAASAPNDEVRRVMSEARASLETEKGRAWLVAVLNIAKATK